MSGAMLKDYISQLKVEQEDRRAKARVRMALKRQRDETSDMNLASSCNANVRLTKRLKGGGNGSICPGRLL